MECNRTNGQIVLPLFYDVNPSEVRHQSGEFGKAFQKLLSTIKKDHEFPFELNLDRFSYHDHQHHDDHPEIKWRGALRQAAALAGFVVLNSRNESETIKDIVESVTQLLAKTTLFIANNPVGVESRVNDMIQLLDQDMQQSHDVLLLGMWEIGLSILVERCLVIVDHKNILRMHGLLRDMGREIIREKSPEELEERCRLWFHEDVVHILSEHTGTKAIKGLALKLPRFNAKCFSSKAFMNMKRLRLLQLAGVKLEGDFEYLSRNLRWLSWNGFSLTYIPANFYRENLVSIELENSNVKLVWKEAQMMENLKILNLSHSHCLRHTPDFSYMPNLEKLILRDCSMLSEVSPSIGDLSKILLIDLEDCVRLRSLPRSIYKLTSLKTLILSGCLMIDKLEDGLEDMESLTTLIANNTAITSVPFSVVRSKSIGYISLCGYEGFASDVFPSIIWSWMSPTNKLTSPFHAFAAMSSLFSLNVPSSSSHELSSFANHLPSLQSLSVECSSELQLSQTAAIILDALHATNYKELEPAATTSQVSNMTTSTLIQCCSQVYVSGSKQSFQSLLIQMGMNCQVTDILKEKILQNIDVNGCGGCVLPDDSFPDWLTFSCEGSSVTFEVPQVEGRNLKTMMCVVYTSTPDSITSDGLKNVLVNNFTKATIEIYKREALVSFEDEEGQRVVSSIEPGNKVEVAAVFENGFIVKNTTVYLVYEEPIGNKKNKKRNQTGENQFLWYLKIFVLAITHSLQFLIQQLVPSHPSISSFSKSMKNPSTEAFRIHEVFLSFRGGDTRASFTSHLYASLQNAGISVFRDDDSLQRGDHISTSINRAIEESMISIIVFSRNYADSRWCLDELVKIMKCHRTIGQVVCPIFYNVDPSEVRHQTGEFGKAFQSLSNKFSKNERLCNIYDDTKNAILKFDFPIYELEKRWIGALQEAAGLAGFVVQNFRNESEAIKHIVEKVTHLIDKLFGEIGISILVERSLVTIDDKNRLGMHDLLRDMGREIIREKSPDELEGRCRLWFHEDVLDLLSEKTGTKAIKGLALKLATANEKCYSTKAFKKMTRLRLLQLAGVKLDGDFGYLSRNLRWLYWNGFSSTHIPTNFNRENLVSIELENSNVKLVSKDIQMMVNLKILNLSHSHCLTHSPDFSCMPNLEKLVLVDCPRLSEVSYSIGHLKKILLINLKDCISLRSLPRSIYKLKSLKSLILSGCTMIEKLEEDLEQMESLTTLLANNTAIKRVPFSVVRSKSIGYISLCGYEGFSCHVFPSIIQSWMSPTTGFPSTCQTSTIMSSLVPLDVRHGSSHEISSILKYLPSLRSLCVECSSELQLSNDAAIILDALNATNNKELESAASTPQVSGNSLKSIFIQLGMNCQVANILKQKIVQNMTVDGCGGYLLPGDSYPYWLTFNCNGSSIIFEVPQVEGRNLKTIMCIVYSSTAEDIASDGLRNLMVKNYTKTTIQLYKREALVSFEDGEGKRLVSSIEAGNKIEVVLVLENNCIVKKTAIYLIYDEPIDETMEQSR
ncbi:disease resistance protein RPV1 [Trifolium repens]|nr:disease resistance protein RPV1 [Trifolium repens]